MVVQVTSNSDGEIEQPQKIPSNVQVAVSTVAALKTDISLTAEREVSFFPDSTGFGMRTIFVIFCACNERQSFWVDENNS